MRNLFAAAFAAVAFASVLTAPPSRAHEGHDHGSAMPIVVPSAQARGEAASEQFELVAIVRGNVLEIHLDTFATNAPITGASIEVETPAGSARAVETPEGIYTLEAPWLPKSGNIDLIFTITSGAITDILPLTIQLPDPAKSGAVPGDTARLGSLGGLAAATLIGMMVGAGALALRRRSLTVLALATLLLHVTPVAAHEGHDHGEKQAAPITQMGEQAKRLPDGSTFVPKSAQRIFALRSLVTQADHHKRSTELPGRVIPDPNASGFVQSTVGGRLSAPQGGFPRLGTKVNAGDVLAYVTPPLQAIDVSDMRQRQGELDQQIAIAERKLARNEILAPTGTVARSQLEDSRTEVQGLKERRAMLDKARRDPEELIAPVSGVIADGSAVAGQIAQPNAVIFHIIDPSKLWVEALSFSVVAEAQSAFARTAAGKTYTITHRGSGFADRSQSIPVHFAIEGDLSSLRAGQFVSVLVMTDEEQSGIAVPRSALVRAANGQDVVYEHVSAELFAPRQVRTSPLDGERVLITAGLTPGKRIVTQGAELLEHVR